MGDLMLSLLKLLSHAGLTKSMDFDENDFISQKTLNGKIYEFI